MTPKLKIALIQGKTVFQFSDIWPLIEILVLQISDRLFSEMTIGERIYMLGFKK